MELELQVTSLKVPSFTRYKTEPLPPIVRPSVNSDHGRDESLSVGSTEDSYRQRHNSLDSLYQIGEIGRPLSLPEVHPGTDLDTLPEVTYGLKPRMAWVYRLMERAGVGARSARALPWYENEKEAFQHHAEYLKRLSKLREELIQQEQSNLANALDRLRMRSYGREFVYSHPQRERKGKQRISMPPDTSGKRSSLLTTFEKFQRMRPKREPPAIMPLEGRSMIEVSNVMEKSDRRHVNQGHLTDRSSERSVDESVRMNLQRLTSHPIPSIPAQRRNSQKDRDIVLESSSYRRGGHQDMNNSNATEDRIAAMQKQKQKLMRLRHEARELEKQKLTPQSFRLDALSDEDRMNLEKLKDFYCIYYVPAPSTSPVDSDNEVHLPKLASNASCGQSVIEDEQSGASTVRSKNGKHVGFRVTSDAMIPPCTCNCTCRMYVSGSKVEAPFDTVDYSISKLHAANNPGVTSGPKVTARRAPASNSNNSNNTSRGSSRDTQKSVPQQTSARDRGNVSPSHSDRMKIHVTMPTIMYSDINTPEPSPDPVTGLVKAFKQKELRQRELTHLSEDIRELNKLSETAASQPAAVK